MSEYSICHYPYTSIQINESGDVHCCCHPWCSSFAFGNILKQPFSEIWNGQRAQEFRKQFLTDQYKYCKLNECINNSDRIYKTTLTAENYPDVVALSYDRICNVQCIFCRGKSCNLSYNLSEFDKTMDNWIPEVFKNAERVSLSGVGEALASPHTRNVMKKLISKFPKIKFDILTNGILMDEKNLNEIGIINNLGVIRFSFHAVKKSTYNKLVKKGNFNKVLKNIKFIAELQKQKKVDQLEFRFVINTFNYKEMVNFAKMAKKYNANVTFLNLLENEDTKELFETLNVISPAHKKHNDLLKILRHPIFKENFVFINQELVKTAIDNKSEHHIKIKFFKQ